MSILVNHRPVVLIHNVKRLIIRLYVLVFKIMLATLLAVVQNVLSVQNVPTIKPAPIKNVLIPVQTLVAKMQNVELIIIALFAIVWMVILEIHLQDVIINLVSVYISFVNSFYDPLDFH